MLTKVIRYVITAQWYTWLRSPKAWTALAMGILIQFGVTIDFLKQARILSYPVQILESFTLVLANRSAQFGLIVGLALLLSDTPFVEGNMPYLIVRVGRVRWVVAVIIHMLLTCMIYFTTLLVVSMLICISSSFVDNSWSPVIWMLARRPDTINMRAGYLIDLNTLSSLSPFTACLWQFILLMIYGFILSMITLLSNMRRNRGIGFAISMILHSVMLVLYLDSHHVGYWLSLFTHASLNTHFSADSVSLTQSILIFSTILLSSVGCAVLLVRRIDIRNTSSPFFR